MKIYSATARNKKRRSRSHAVTLLRCPRILGYAPSLCPSGDSHDLSRPLLLFVCFTCSQGEQGRQGREGPPSLLLPCQRQRSDALGLAAADRRRQGDGLRDIRLAAEQRKAAQGGQQSARRGQGPTTMPPTLIPYYDAAHADNTDDVVTITMRIPLHL